MAFRPSRAGKSLVGCLYDGPMPDRLANEEYEIELVRRWMAGLQNSWFQMSEDHVQFLELNGQQVEAGTYPAVQRNSAYTRDPSRKIPKPLVIHVMINGHRARALVDSGSLGDFMSSTLAEQLKLKKKQLTTPLPVQLAVQGSRSKVNFGMAMKFEYQRISCDRYFDIINLSNYDLILGTPFLYQHRVTMDINPPRLVIGGDSPLSTDGPGVTCLASWSMATYEDNLEQIWKHLCEYVEPLCRSAGETPLPPLRSINHEIPLIDPD